MFAGSGVARDDRTLQRMAEPGTKAALSRSLVVQVFMKPRGHGMVNGGAHGVSREPCAQALAESGRSASVVLWMTGHLTKCSAADHATDSAFAERRMLPMTTVWMFLFVR